MPWVWPGCGDKRKKNTNTKRTHTQKKKKKNTKKKKEEKQKQTRGQNHYYWGMWHHKETMYRVTQKRSQEPHPRRGTQQVARPTKKSMACLLSTSLDDGGREKKKHASTTFILDVLEGRGFYTGQRSRTKKGSLNRAFDGTQHTSRERSQPLSKKNLAS